MPETVSVSPDIFHLQNFRNLPANTDDTDLLARPTAESGQRGVYRQASAKHRGSNRSLDVVWNLEREVFVRSDVRGVTTLGDGTICELGTVGINGVWAVVLLISLAVVACQLFCG